MPEDDPQVSETDGGSNDPAGPVGLPVPGGQGEVFVVPEISFDADPDIPSVGIRKSYGLGEVGDGGPTGPAESSSSSDDQAE